LLFTNWAAVMIMIGCFFRLWQAQTISFFLNDYMKVYADDYQSFSEQAAFASLVGGPFSTFFTGAIVDYFSTKSEMTIPILCCVKSIIEIPFNMMTFYQQKSFKLSMTGIYLEYFLAKGWTSGAIFILKTVVHPSITYLSISIFILLTSLNSIVSANIMAFMMDKYDIKPRENPDKYGTLVTLQTTIPLILCVPFFFYGGLIMRNVKRKKIASGEENREE
jgi:hypothetical protein